MVTAQAYEVTGESIADLHKQIAQMKKEAEAKDKLLREFQTNSEKVSVHC